MTKYLPYVVTGLAATVAALAVLPYEWSRIAAASLSAALSALYPVNSAVVRMRAKGTNASA